MKLFSLLPLSAGFRIIRLSLSAFHRWPLHLRVASFCPYTRPNYSGESSLANGTVASHLISPSVGREPLRFSPWEHAVASGWLCGVLSWLHNHVMLSEKRPSRRCGYISISEGRWSMVKIYAGLVASCTIASNGHVCGCIGRTAVIFTIEQLWRG